MKAQISLKIAKRNVLSQSQSPLFPCFIKKRSAVYLITKESTASDDPVHCNPELSQLTAYCTQNLLFYQFQIIEPI